MTDDPSQQFRLDDRIVLVTGASSGLGERFARTAAAAGARVALAARRVDRLDSLAAEIPLAHAFSCDLSEPGQGESLVDRVVEHFGGIDVVVNNAGVSHVVPALDYPVEEFTRELQLDLVAPYAVARRAASWMIPNGLSGSIINVGSVLGTVAGGRLRAPGYAAAKGGLHNLTRELASQWARKGVRVNTLAPGWFASEMNASMLETEGGRAYIDNGTPMGRQGRPHELDGALLFLASAASTFVTGTVLYVDGGWTAI
ncbi:MAG: SDR family oxidoreductase [Acidimicrobiia bacterium]|nr:SDR family oxidoreductase [Acidimicrobiia bacterium]MDH5236386.1 SDR family oxidoreductase [Acidimicrobiia bacterium]